MNNAPLTAREIHGPYVQLLTNLQGEHGQEWLDALKRFNRKENPWASLYLKRSQRFDPNALRVKLGFADDQYWTIISQVDFSLETFSEVKLTSVKLQNLPTKQHFKGEKGYGRLKEIAEEKGWTLLDAEIAIALWENPHLIPDSWKELDHVTFPGTLMKNKHGGLAVLGLKWYEKKWSISFFVFNNGWEFIFPAATI
ncbi:MAG: hypothetical protein ACAH17_02925 [Candidatus Paceibacterota bacterium]